MWIASYFVNSHPEARGLVTEQVCESDHGEAEVWNEH